MTELSLRARGEPAAPVERGGGGLSVVVVTGIFPPDIGGPATHTADLAGELGRRGHQVTVLTLTDEPRTSTAGGVVRYPRRWPWPVRMLAVAWWLVRRRRSYDVVYATGMHAEAVLGARLARRSVVVKIVGDPAWERASRRGLTDADFETFQAVGAGSWAGRSMQWVRDWTVRRASSVVVPSDHLRSTVLRWQRGRGPSPTVIPNGVVVPKALHDCRRRDLLGPLRLLFVGRLVPVKRVDELLRAVAEIGGVELTIVGDGPEAGALHQLATSLGLRRRVRFSGPVAHEVVLEELAGADVAVLASSHEGLPHVVIEALAVGTPVVTSAAGGTIEVIVDGENGRVVEPATAEAFSKVLAELRDDRAELARLARGARSSGAAWRFDRCADAIERILRDLAGDGRRPRVVNVGKSWVGDPPGRGIERKFEIVARHLDATFLVTGPRRSRHIAGVRVIALPSLRPRLLGGALFYAAAPAVALVVAAVRPGTAVVCQSPFEAAGVLALRRLLPAVRRPRVVVEVHGDWRTATRYYGSHRRRVLSPAADRVAAWAVRGADRVRVIGDFTEAAARRTGREDEFDRYVAFSEFDAFLEPAPKALPATPVATFIGVLEPCKAPDVLIAAWRDVAAYVPGARLCMVGAGPLGGALRRQAAKLGIAPFVEFAGHLDQRRLIELLDASWCLVLPSPAEGLGRVVLEAMARGRPVVGSNSGGVPELVEHGVTGLLVEPGDARALADALGVVLRDPALAAQMGAEARRRVEKRDPGAEFEAGVARLARWVAGR